MKHLLVFNICGLKKDNTNLYIKNIEKIINNNNKINNLFDIVISSVFNTEECRKELKRVFGDKIKIVCLDHKLAVNHTFNISCDIISQISGPYLSFTYCASDIDIGDNNILGPLAERLSNPDNAMVAVQVNNDSGADYWLEGIQYPSPNDFEIPMGKTLSLHLQGFSREIYNKYGGLVPDIFTSYCCESIFWSMCAAIRKKFIVMGGPVAHHAVSMDGNCRVFGGHQDLTYPGTLTMAEIIAQAKAENVPLFYQAIFAKGSKWGERLHCLGDPNEFDATGAKDDRLYYFIKNHFFLPKFANHVSYRVL